MLEDATVGGRKTEDGGRLDDAALLRRYATSHAEEDFAELVRRHVNLVYSCALRQVNGDAHLAQDVTQLVFIDLARKAEAVANRQVLAGWLFTSTRFAAAKAVRGEQRRHAREIQAQLMQEINRDPAAHLDWDRVRPVLDEVLGELSDSDREAILLRFFENRDFASVGAKLNMSDNSARMRVERALDKLRALLERRGVRSTSAALAAVLASEAVLAAPAGLAVTVTGAATAAATGGAWVTFMSMTKLQMVAAGVIAVAGATGFVAQTQATTRLRDEVDALREQNRAAATLTAENVRLARAAGDAETAQAQAAELTRLRDEAAALRGRSQAIAAARSAQPEAARKSEAVFTGTFFEPSQVDAPPKPTFQARPTYPKELRTMDVNGSATVDFVVDDQGRVRNATVLDATHPAFGESALEAVRQWEFQPGQKSNQSVPVHVRVPIGFKVNGAGTATPRSASTFAPWF